MKYISVLIMLCSILLPITAQESADTIVMKDFDKSLKGFSFSEGGIIELNQESEEFPMEIDFIFDMPHGIGMNNSELTSWFSGNAGIIDLGSVSLEANTEIPSAVFNPSLAPEDIIPGHTYLIRSSTEGNYGKIHILQFYMEKEIIEFTWTHFDK